MPTRSSESAVAPLTDSQDVLFVNKLANPRHIFLEASRRNTMATEMAEALSYCDLPAGDHGAEYGALMRVLAHLCGEAETLHAHVYHHLLKAEKIAAAAAEKARNRKRSRLERKLAGSDAGGGVIDLAKRRRAMLSEKGMFSEK